jgi:hypothetical protein
MNAPGEAAGAGSAYAPFLPVDGGTNNDQLGAWAAAKMSRLTALRSQKLLRYAS